ncbi:MAG: hypothetical protein J3R72DRAFT_484948 [Linnemannia gamsii]|nr:MAG: hypothetical protein J3R72DRAFT_484948 [Linnemannia gamsii]
MSPITSSSAARMVRVAAPLRTAAIRQFSAAAPAAESSAPAVTLHSTKKLAITSGVAFVAGVDVTYAYFTLGQKLLVTSIEATFFFYISRKDSAANK